MLSPEEEAMQLDWGDDGSEGSEDESKPSYVQHVVKNSPAPSIDHDEEVIWIETVDSRVPSSQNVNRARNGFGADVSSSLTNEVNRLRTEPDLSLGPFVNQAFPSHPAFASKPKSLVLMKWADIRGELRAEWVADLAIGKAMAPLGCAFDTTLGFLFTAQNEIMTCSENGVVEQTPLIKHLNRPTAVCSIEHGVSLAILDYASIYVFRLDTHHLAKVGAQLNGTCRGLAYTSSKCLFTVKNVNGLRISAILLDPTGVNKVVSSIDFPIGHSQSKPSFCSATNNFVYVTDLGCNRLVVFNAEGGNLVITNVVSFDHCPHPFSFVSGIVTDSRHEILVADANKRKLFSLTSFGDAQKEVNIVGNSFPYCAGLAVSPNGFVLACGRRSNSMHLFKLLKVKEEK